MLNLTAWRTASGTRANRRPDHSLRGTRALDACRPWPTAIGILMAGCLSTLFTLLAGVDPVWCQERLTIRPAVQTVRLTGYTRARATRTIAAEVGGKVLRVHYDVGQIIDGRPFLEIDPTFLAFQIAQVRWRRTQSDISRERHLSRTAFLQKEFDRINALYQDQVTPLARWEAVAEELSQARLSLRGVEAEIGLLDSQLAELAERHRRHTVAAPEGWGVVARQVEPGEIISPGSPLARVGDFRQLMVPLFVSEAELAALRSGGDLPATVSGRPGRARLHWVNPEFDERTRKSHVTLLLVEHDGAQRGGLLVTVPLELGALGLLVPRAAVTDRYGNPFVRVAPGEKRIAVFPLGEQGDDLIVADQEELAAGMVLMPSPEGR